jgi:Protein of unknown function (DUF3224)
MHLHSRKAVADNVAVRAICTMGLAAVAFSAATPAPANAEASNILADYHDPGTEITPSTAITCGLGGEPIHGSATFGAQTGAKWHGITSYDYCLYLTTVPDKFSYSGTETLTGSVDGCGTGSFTWTGAGTFVLGSSNGGGTWRIVPGSGTGDLANASGSGTDTADVSLTFENDGYFAGEFTC